MSAYGETCKIRHYEILLCFIVAGFIIGLFDYDKKMTKKTEEEKRKAEQDHNNELMRQYLEKKLNEEREKENENEKQK